MKHQYQNLIPRFMRVHGPGLFHQDEFCTITGCPAEIATKILSKHQGILVLAPDYYLLKPQPTPKVKRAWNDWKFKPQIQRHIFDACSSSPQTSVSLKMITGLGDTTLRRYLKAMENSGNLVSRRSGHFKIYIAGSWKALTTYRSELGAKLLRASGQ